MYQLLLSLPNCICQTIETYPFTLEPTIQNIHIYLDFAKEDNAAADKLLAHLAILQQNHPIRIWYQGLMLPGVDKEQTWRKELHQSQIVLLLISSNYLACNEFVELKKTLITLPGTKVFPILIKPCAWQVDPFFEPIESVAFG